MQDSATPKLCLQEWPENTYPAARMLASGQDRRLDKGSETFLKTCMEACLASQTGSQETGFGSREQRPNSLIPMLKMVWE